MLDELEQRPIKRRKPTVPINTLLSDGQRAYNEKRYKQAVTYFTSVIDAANDHTLDLIRVYDLRAHSYFKSQDFDQALRDAKTMIKLDRSDPKGYLNAAHFEQHQGHLTTAIKVCDLGLKNVPKGINKDQAELEARRRSIAKAIKNSIVFQKGMDPLQVLPTELLSLVLATFDYREIVVLTRVSKTWRRVLSSLDILSRTIDTHSVRRKVSYHQMQVMFARLGKHPHTLILANLNQNAASLANKELCRKIRWEGLQVLDCEDAKLQVSPTLCDKMQSLQHLHIGRQSCVIESLHIIIPACPCLRFLHMSGTISHKNDASSLRPPLSSQCLQHLVIRLDEKSNILGKVSPIANH